jgi:tricorn protease
MPEGYVRFPHVLQDTIVFVAEDDLWLVSLDGGRAERLTAAVNEVNHPRFSPDGQWLAFVGRDEGPSEVYVMSASGGPSRRLTFQAANCQVLGWTPDGQEILYASNANQFTQRSRAIFAISPEGGQPRQLPFGMANAISYGPDGGIVLGRNIREPAHWKRYRGGTAGHLWCDANGSGIFKRLLNLNGNIAAPCWVGERIYFLSDHEGVGNVYSCTPQGDDVRRHTDHQDFYARNLSSDGQRMVYHAGANLYLFDPDRDNSQRIEVDLPSLRTQRNRKFVSASRYLDSYALHPQGYAVALTTRGKAFSMGNWEGPVLQHGEPDGVRYRMLEWLNDGKRFVAVSDETGREALVIFNPEVAEEPKVLSGIEFGRAMSLEVSPQDDLVAITNHRNELIMVNLEAEESIVVDKSDYGRIGGLAWSPDGGWLAYCFEDTAQTSVIKLCNIENGETHTITEPVAGDFCPSFDPEGKYLYFLGHRTFNPVNDSLQFERSFPRSVKPYVILLRKDLRSPFMPEPKAPGGKDKDKDKDDKDNNGPKKSLDGTHEEESKLEAGDGDAQEGVDGQVEQAHQADNSENEAANGRKPALQIDLDGITSRVLPFPVSEARYRRVRGIKGKALFLQFPIEGTIHTQTDADSHEPKGSLWSFDFETLKYEYVLDGVSSFEISRDAKTLIYESHNRLRVLKAGDKAPKTESGEPSRETGWLDLHRVKVSVQPAAEWKQMFAEAWRLQREHFWAEDMSGVDWQAVYDQYAPLVERVSSRSELSDLFWELQGELGTSHAYEMGGEYRQGPHYSQGFLGVDWYYDAENDRYRIARIVQGDTWDERATSPLNTPGIGVHIGDAVVAVNGQRVNAKRSPQELLVNQAKNEVQLTVEDAESHETHVVTVKALASDWTARYREWVEHNRSVVHEQSGGKVGYVHIPDMGPEGYAEFHRSYLREYDYPALLIDVRWNGGGNVSSLLLEKLARKRIAYAFSRWGQPEPYPHESPRGPMVALTNEQAGSDGDIFSHNFKLMGLGPLIGMRTWGGVIGISPSHHLVDGTRTTQPEFAYWFKDVGWNVENYGTNPDIEVDIAPQDYARGNDPQLNRAIQEALRLIEERPAFEPKPEDRPRRGRLL